MSINIPAIAQIPRPKAYFYFYSPLQNVFSSPTVSDTTTSRATTGATRVTIKSYSLTIPSGANSIRVVVYGYVHAPAGVTFTGVFILNIDGVDVARASTTSKSEVLIIDYIGSISPGSHTIRIDGYIEDGTTEEIYVSKVYIATGIGVTTTTLSNLITFSVTYQLVRNGDIRYSPGVRLFIYGNRKTTATARLEVGASPRVGRNQLGAGNDNTTPEVFLAIITGSVTFNEGGEYSLSVTLRGAVGASGDVVIVTRILARAQLRFDYTRDRVGEVRVYERGVVEYAGRALLVSVPGGASNTSHHMVFRNIQDTAVIHPSPIGISGHGASIILYNFRVATVTPVHFWAGSGDDVFGEGFLEWVQVVVWG